jgi:hypothetical protein
MKRKGNHFLLKTFSTNPFHGQYPMIAVNANMPPTTMEAGFQNPDRRKPHTMRTMPRTARRIPSPLPTFLVKAI